jgi:hypothetical protein
VEHTQAKPPRTAGDSDAGGGWQQQAGFSVFFDRRISATDLSEWRTRLYHDEPDEATSILGLDPAGWIPWIVDRLPDVGRRGTQRLIGVEVSGVKTMPSTGEYPGSGYFEIGLRIDGLSELGQAVGAAVIAAALSALASSSAGESPP